MCELQISNFKNASETGALNEHTNIIYSIDIASMWCHLARIFYTGAISESLCYTTTKTQNNC